MWPTTGVPAPAVLEPAEFNTPVGLSRTTTSGALREVCSRRQTSNPTPACPFAAPTASQIPTYRLAGTSHSLQSAAAGGGSTAQVPRVAAVAVGTAADLATARHRAYRACRASALGPVL